MLLEHDSAGDALARIREVTSGYTPPEDACNTYRAFYYELAELESDLHRHIPWKTTSCSRAPSSWNRDKKVLLCSDREEQCAT